jgi:hypothetical protein
VPTLLKIKIEISLTALNAATLFSRNGDWTIQNEVENENERGGKMQANVLAINLSASSQVKLKESYTKISSSWKFIAYFFRRKNQNYQSWVKIKDKREVDRKFKD